MFDAACPVPSHPHPAAQTGKGFLHSVETAGAMDGPGTRFVFFIAGCLSRCLYCHNPDTWKLHHGREVTVEQTLAEIRPYASFLRIAGGVTISGGEPMVQAGFVGALASRIKTELQLHMALDTQDFLNADPGRCLVRSVRPYLVGYQTQRCRHVLETYRSGSATDAGFRPSPCRHGEADVDTLCPGTRLDRRRNRHPAAGRFHCHSRCSGGTRRSTFVSPVGRP
jgi:hypothetical protein